MARKESTADAFAIDELQKQIEATLLPLKIVYSIKDTEFRREIDKLKKQNTSFLFLDEFIWSLVSNVLPVQLSYGPRKGDLLSFAHVCCSFRIGDGFIMRDGAPPIYKIVHNFKPNATDLLNILENEISTDNNTIIEAACMWALQHFEQFKQMIPPNFNNIFHPTNFTIEVYFCERDPYIDEYKKTIEELEQVFRQTLKKIRLAIHSSFTDCLDVESLIKNLRSLGRKQSIVGSITWSWFSGEQYAAREASNSNLPLLLIGPTDPDVPVNDTATAVHAANGGLIDLIRAYKHLLQLCKWSRIAILSDKSTFSKKIMNTFLRNDKNLIHREIIVTSSNIDSALKSLDSEDARIFLVNANWNITSIILCTALKQGMTGASFMWITRDRGVFECDKENKTALHHYTLELTSRKGPATIVAKDLLMETTDGTELTPGKTQSASLADALLQLGYGFATFIDDYPFLVYNLRKTTSTM